jgi:hypothetical protein
VFLHSDKEATEPIFMFTLHLKMPGPAARAGVPLVTGGSSTRLSAWHGSQQRQNIGALRVSASKGFGKATQQKKQVEASARMQLNGQRGDGGLGGPPV